MDSQFFKVVAIQKYYGNDMARLESHAKGQDLIISLCSYCSKVVDVKKAKGCPGISHGACYECLIVEYAKMELEPDPEMFRARDKLNERYRQYGVFEKQG